MIDIHNCKHLKQRNTDFTITSNEKSVYLYDLQRLKLVYHTDR